MSDQDRDALTGLQADIAFYKARAQGLLIERDALMDALGVLVETMDDIVSNRLASHIGNEANLAAANVLDKVRRGLYRH